MHAIHLFRFPKMINVSTHKRNQHLLSTVARERTSQSLTLHLHRTWSGGHCCMVYGVRWIFCAATKLAQSGALRHPHQVNYYRIYMCVCVQKHPLLTVSGASLISLRYGGACVFIINACAIISSSIRTSPWFMCIATDKRALQPAPHHLYSPLGALTFLIIVS